MSSKPRKNQQFAFMHKFRFSMWRRTAGVICFVSLENRTSKTLYCRAKTQTHSRKCRILCGGANWCSCVGYTFLSGTNDDCTSEYSFPLEFFRDGIFSRSCNQRMNMRTSFMLNSPCNWGCRTFVQQKAHGTTNNFTTAVRKKCFGTYTSVAIAFLCKLKPIAFALHFMDKVHTAHRPYSCSAMNQTITDTWNEKHLFSKFCLSLRVGCARIYVDTNLCGYLNFAGFF